MANMGVSFFDSSPKWAVCSPERDPGDLRRDVGDADEGRGLGRCGASRLGEDQHGCLLKESHGKPVVDPGKREVPGWEEILWEISRYLLTCKQRNGGLYVP